MAPPATVLVPTLPVAAGDREVSVVLRQVEPGLVVLLAYSSLARLVAGCGPRQPWVSVRAEVVDELASSAGATAVLLDVALPEQDTP